MATGLYLNKYDLEEVTFISDRDYPTPGTAPDLSSYSRGTRQILAGMAGEVDKIRWKRVQQDNESSTG